MKNSLTSFAITLALLMSLYTSTTAQIYQDFERTFSIVQQSIAEKGSRSKVYTDTKKIKQGQSVGWYVNCEANMTYRITAFTDSDIYSIDIGMYDEYGFRIEDFEFSTEYNDVTALEFSNPQAFNGYIRITNVNSRKAKKKYNLGMLLSIDNTSTEKPSEAVASI